MHQTENTINSLHTREEQFHDHWAESESIEDIDVRAVFESFVAMENNFILQQIGNLNGKKVLDIGAGLGESSVYFALQGAEVFYNDVSPKMGEFAQKLAAYYGVNIQTIIAPIENLLLHSDTYDFIYCANVLHHIAPQEQESQVIAMHCALKSGGMLCAIDPLKYNPVINIYRKMATGMRTVDEQPVGFDILKMYRNHFATVTFKTYWLSTLWLFIHYYLVRQYSPNKIRYWKQIFKEKENKIGWWFKLLKAVDKLLLSLPQIQKLAWNIVIIAQK